MRLLILGASGGCGSWLMRLAAQRGHEVTAVVRHNTPFEGMENVHVQRAEVNEPGALDAIVPGHDAVLSCLGLRRAGFSPWARLLSPVDLTERVTRSLVESMRKSGVERLVVISAGGVGDSARQLSRGVRWLVSSGNIAVAYRDLARMEAVLESSDLDWLAVRPVTLWWGKPTGRGRVVDLYTMTSMIRRAGVAEFMLRQVEMESRPFSPRTALVGV